MGEGIFNNCFREIDFLLLLADVIIFKGMYKEIFFDIYFMQMPFQNKR